MPEKECMTCLHVETNEVDGHCTAMACNHPDFEVPPFDSQTKEIDNIIERWTYWDERVCRLKGFAKWEPKQDIVEVKEGVVMPLPLDHAAIHAERLARFKADALTKTVIVQTEYYDPNDIFAFVGRVDGWPANSKG